MTTPFAPSGRTEDPALRRAATFAENSLRSTLHALAARSTPGSPAAEATSAAVELLAALPTKARQAALLHPVYRIWRTRLTRLVGAGAREPVENWLLHLPRMLAGPALGTGTRLPSVHLPVTGGELRLPGVPRHLRLPSGVTRVLLHEDELAVDGRRYPTSGLLYGGPDLIEHVVLPGTETELDSSDPWIHDSIAEHNRIPASPLYPSRDVAPAPVSQATAVIFRDAARLVGRAWQGCLDELATHVRLVVPFTSERLAGWTPADQLGAIYVRATRAEARLPDSSTTIDPIGRTAERLVHEAAHTRLTYLSVGRELFTAGGRRQPLRSPLRKGPRPAYGVYQAAFVLARVVVFMRRAAWVTGLDAYAERAEQCHRDLRAAAGSLNSAGVLSAYGRDLLDQATRAADDAVPASTEAGAV